LIKVCCAVEQFTHAYPHPEGFFLRITVWLGVVVRAVIDIDIAVVWVVIGDLTARRGREGAVEADRCSVMPGKVFVNQWAVPIDAFHSYNVLWELNVANQPQTGSEGQ